MFRLIALVLPCVLWLFLMRGFLLGHIPVNMDTHTIYGVTKYYFNNLFNGVVPLWDPFVALGRPFYAIAICNLFNPFAQLILVLKLLGVNYYAGFIIYIVVYFFAGCAGFYGLAKEFLKDRGLAYLAVLALLFSSLGASMFTQLTLLEILVPTVWFFFFLFRFFRCQNIGSFLGLAFSIMVLISSYLPFYFVTVFLFFAILFMVLYPTRGKDFLMRAWKFKFKHWRLSLFCLAGVVVAASPLIAYKVLDASGQVVAPGRHCEYSSAQECYQRTMGRQGAMSYDEITRSGTLGERVDMQYFFGDLGKVTYGSDSFFFLPVWVYALLVLSMFVRLKRPTVLLTGLALVVGLIALGKASFLHRFLYDHVPLFGYFRNLFFFGAFLLPIVILLAFYQLQRLLSIKPSGAAAKKGMVIGILVLHGLFFLFLRHFVRVPMVSFVTVGLSAAAFAVYYAGGFRWSGRVWTTIFAGVLLLQPIWVLRAYAANAREFQCPLPSMSVRPVFQWLRPEKAATNSCRIYQFVPYEDFWYDMSMTDAPAKVGYPQSAARWAFVLSQRMGDAALEKYARYKIVLYDGPGLPPQPVMGPSPQLSVRHFDVNDLVLDTDFTREKVLVYNDSYTSSWKVLVDGKPANMLRANGAFKGVKVPAGEHQVAFCYRPPGGWWVYVAATLLLFIFMILTLLMLYWKN